MQTLVAASGVSCLSQGVRELGDGHRERDGPNLFLPLLLNHLVLQLEAVESPTISRKRPRSRPNKSYRNIPWPLALLF